MTIGLLSDTHGYFDDSLEKHFKGCKEIWHAGDIGNMHVVAKLRNLAPVCAVFGNIDDADVRSEFPEDLWLERAGITFLITHIAGRPPRYHPRVAKILRERSPNVLICGHSHICQVQKVEKQNHLFVNPGAAGQHGFHHMRTALRMELGEGKINKLQVIELGKRGSTSLTT